MLEYRSKLGENGRIVIPSSCRKALHLQAGEEIIFRIEDDELRLFSVKHAVKHAQAIVKKYNKNNKKLSDELLAMRKEEAERE